MGPFTLQGFTQRQVGMTTETRNRVPRAWLAKEINAVTYKLAKCERSYSECSSALTFALFATMGGHVTELASETYAAVNGGDLQRCIESFVKQLQCLQGSLWHLWLFRGTFQATKGLA